MWTNNGVSLFVLYLGSVATTLTVGQEWGPMKTYTFSGNDQHSPAAVLDGCTTTICDLQAGTPVLDENKLDDLAIVAPAKKGKCKAVSANNCNSKYLVQKGVIDDGLGTKVVDAYRVHPPTTKSLKSTKFKSKLWFRVPASATHYRVYRFVESSSAGPAEFVAEQDLKGNPEGGFVETDIEVHKIGTKETPKIYFVIDVNDTDFKVWPDPADGTTTVKATVFEGVSLESKLNYKLSLYAELFDLNAIKGTPFDPVSSWKGSGPDQHYHKYSWKRVFNKVYKQDGTEGVVWQDEITLKIYVTWITKTGHESIELPNVESFPIYGATGDGGKNGHIVYITISPEKPVENDKPLDLYSTKVDSSGNTLVKFKYDTDYGGSDNRDGIKVWKEFNAASVLAWDADSGEIAWLITRTMLVSEDGVNHQACHTYILDEATLDLKAKKGQTASHCFQIHVSKVDESSSSKTSSPPTFMSVVVGDAYPRAIKVSKFTSAPKTTDSINAFEIKRRHKTDPGDAPYPVYKEISNDDVTFYQWSEPVNAIFSEIAEPPLVTRPSDGSHLVLFAAESPSLDNAKVLYNLNSPRNLGLVIVSEDLATVRNIAGHDAEVGGYYDKKGQWKDLVNKVKWLTDFTPDADRECDCMESAVRIKTVRCGNLVLLLYEVWRPKEYLRTEVMAIDDDGNVVVEATTLPYMLRLTPTDPIELGDDGHIYFYGASSPDDSLIRFRLELGAVSSLFKFSAASRMNGFLS